MSKAVKEAFLKIFGRFLAEKKTVNMKKLAVFDFDHTIIDDNSDTAVLNLVSKNEISPELKGLHKQEGWTAFMQGVFEVLHKNNVTESTITNFIKKLPEVKGMKTFIKEIHDNLNYDIIIISDSNSLFINTWLEANNVSSKVLRVYSNPAHFNEQGLLVIEMYHIQDSCKLSTRNMCKGMIMEDFINDQLKQGVEYEKVVYVGDGQNDFCPILRLKENDLACVRNNYKCIELIKKAKSENHNAESTDGANYNVKAHVFTWQNGLEILNYLKV